MSVTPDARTDRVRLGDVRGPQLSWNLAVLATIVAAAVLYLTAYKTFFLDEWAFVTTRRDWSWEVLMFSHNGHWSTLFVLVWKVLFVVFGITSHLPYQAAGVLAHVAAVAMLFVLVRRRAGDAPAFAVAVTLLVFGSGAANIDWAFQLAWCASVAFGLLAMILLDERHTSKRRLTFASIALLCSLMFSNVGLIFLAAVVVELALDRRHWRSLAVVVVPMAIFCAWFFAYDTGSVANAPGVAGQIGQGPHGLSYVFALMAFVAVGVGATAAGVFGLPGGFGLIALSVVAALIGFGWVRHRRIDGWKFGPAIGFVAWFVLVGAGRLQYGSAYAGQSRYVYVGAAFLLPLVAAAIRELPWHGLYRPALVALFAVCVFGNALQLRQDALSQVEPMKTETAELQTVELFRGAPDMALNVPIDTGLMPTIAAGPYLAAVDQLGSPVPRASLDEISRQQPDAVDKVMVDLFGPALRVGPDPTLQATGMRCRLIDSTRGTNVELRVPNAMHVMLRSELGGNVVLFLGYVRPPSRVPVTTAMLPAAADEWVHLPDAGKPVAWRLGITAAPMGMLLVCGDVAVDVRDNASRRYSAQAAVGALGPGWSVSADAAAVAATAAKATAGRYPSFANDVFMNPATVPAGAYDVWFRVRVSSPLGTTPEMTLGLWDDQKQAWVGNTKYAASQLSTEYSWVKVASDVLPSDRDTVQFIASFSNRLGSDWYVDSAVMQPAGAPPPALI